MTGAPSPTRRVRRGRRWRWWRWIQLEASEAPGYGQTVRLPPLSVLVGGPNDPPGGAGQHHPVVNQAQDFNYAIRCQAVDDEVPRTSDAARWLDALPGKPGRVGADTREAGHVDRAV